MSMTHVRARKPVKLCKTPGDYYRQRVARRWFRAGQVPGWSPSFARIVDCENLLEVYYNQKSKAGQATGPDGIGYEAMGASEIAESMRGLAKCWKNGSYRPGPSRKVSIAKSLGNGSRTISIRNVPDRIVSGAVARELRSLWEGIFLPGSLGFRSKKGIWDVLLGLERLIGQEKRLVLVQEDIQNAFDNVGIEATLEDHGKYIQDEALLQLIGTILRGGDLNRKVGIDQGDPYSPTVLNVRLHHVHDLGISQDPRNPPWLRYADDLLYCCRDVSEGAQVKERCKALLSAGGFTLKGENSLPIHLQDSPVTHLGFRVSWEGKVVYGLTQEAWNGLSFTLNTAHEAGNPPAAAYQALLGWINAYGPAFESRYGEHATRILCLAALSGYREIISWEDLIGELKGSWDRWTIRRRTIGLRD